MQCPSCKQTIQAEWKSCPFCQLELNTKTKCTGCGQKLQATWQSCPFCSVPANGSSPATPNQINPLGYCGGSQSAIYPGDPHFICIKCKKLYTEKFRFHALPVCESCAYKDGTAQQLEKELSAQREVEAKEKEEQLRKERVEQEQREAEKRAAIERQQKEEEERKAREAAEALKKPHVCPITGMEFVIVPEGEFQMGDVWGDGNDREKPTRLVAVLSFQMAKYPVTQSQWLKVMGGENPATSSGKRFVHSDKPVINVSWDDAQEFIKRLNRKSGCNYRLPSEAEWEYSARSGGSRDKYSGTSSESSLSAYAHFGQKYSEGSPQPVGKKRPNDLELYDMSGNVWEWCTDNWHNNYQSAPCDGSPWTSGGNSSQRVYRGGSWNDSSSGCRVACRGGFVQGLRYRLLGFRLSQDSR